jgi:hypothetical protein
MYQEPETHSVRGAHMSRTPAHTELAALSHSPTDQPLCSSAQERSPMYRMTLPSTRVSLSERALYRFESATKRSRLGIGSAVGSKARLKPRSS